MVSRVRSQKTRQRGREGGFPLHGPRPNRNCDPNLKAWEKRTLDPNAMRVEAMDGVKKYANANAHENAHTSPTIVILITLICVEA